MQTYSNYYILYDSKKKKLRISLNISHISAKDKVI